MHRRFYEKYLGNIASVLFEHTNKDGYMFGFTENYIRVAIPYNNALSNTIVQVKMESIRCDGIVSGILV